MFKKIINTYKKLELLLSNQVNEIHQRKDDLTIKRHPV